MEPTVESILQRSAKIKANDQRKEFMIASFLISIGFFGLLPAMQPAPLHPATGARIQHKPAIQDAPLPSSLIPFYIAQIDQLESALNKTSLDLIKAKDLLKENKLANINAWELAVSKTLELEGGYGIDNNGYPVNHGINQKWYKPLKGFPQEVKNLTKKQAERYYKVNYWAPLHIDKTNYSQQYKAYLFDIAVNKGVSVAQKVHRKAQGNFKTAVQLRIQHLRNWFKRGKTGTCGRQCYQSLIARAKSFDNIV